MLNDKNILITGGTGSFGKRFVQRILSEYRPKRLIIFSRDELKQFEMAKTFNEEKHRCLRYFLGDVRDKARLMQALRGVDIVIHAAALKHVPAAEYNPFEYIKTNVHGAQNIIEAAIERGVSKVVALSTDKASNPINLYGATKLCSDKLFVAGNNYSGENGCVFSVVRYGNVIGSRGSVIPFFLNCESNSLPITDERMTRFLITLDQGVDLVFKALAEAQGGEIFIPKIPSMKINDIARATSPQAELRYIGIRPGEKLHESMISSDDAPFTYEYPDHFRILPSIISEAKLQKLVGSGKLVKEGFEYTSDKNAEWLEPKKLSTIIAAYKHTGPELQHLSDKPVRITDF